MGFVLIYEEKGPNRGLFECDEDVVKALQRFKIGLKQSDLTVVKSGNLSQAGSLRQTESYRSPRR